MRLFTFKIKSLDLKFGNKRIKKYSLPLTQKSYFKDSIIIQLKYGKTIICNDKNKENYQQNYYPAIKNNGHEEQSMLKK